MNACILFIFASQLAFVTPACYIDDNTMIEPENIIYVQDLDHINGHVYVAPQAYHDHWSVNGAPIPGSWDPDVYLRIDLLGLTFVYEPWRTPIVRVRHNHYDAHHEFLQRRHRAHSHSRSRAWKERRVSHRAHRKKNKAKKNRHRAHNHSRSRTWKEHRPSRRAHRKNKAKKNRGLHKAAIRFADKITHHEYRNRTVTKSSRTKRRERKLHKRTRHHRRNHRNGKR